METLAAMTLGQLAGSAAAVAAVLSVFVEIAPVKVRPVTAFLAWLGRKINGAVLGKVERLEQKLDELDRKTDENEVDRIRWESLDFANSCRGGQRHTKDAFDHIIAQNTKYHRMIQARGMQNGQVDLEFEYIADIFRRCLRESDFL